MNPVGDSIGIPQSFILEHVNQHDLARRLGLNEGDFWRSYLAGEILTGVPMLEVIGEPWLVWPKADVERWISAGRPVNVEVQDRTRRVHGALRRAIELEHGRPLEQLAADMVAQSN